MDYAVWETLKQKGYSGRRNKFTEDELRAKILSAWGEIHNEIIKKVLPNGNRGCEW